eukprot:TRINITY_DN9345_c0_g1_i3.p1 TRINITY_DN9345_c0_g1~~TRINITY_DN9345_c0_g1_i3.p1  ORF type:complete len:273 (-),score=44.73 TRINITY_DN9345_c0_g1_i3:336-1154(-)
MSYKKKRSNPESSSISSAFFNESMIIEIEGEKELTLSQAKKVKRDYTLMHEDRANLSKRPNVIEYIYRSHNIMPLSIDISQEDIEILETNKDLNSTIINFYLKYLEQECIEDGIRSRVYMFSTHFYKDIKKIRKLSKQNCFKYFSKLKKWTDGVDIFAKDYLFIPMCHKSHWLLAIVCNPNAVFDNAIQFIRSNYTLVPKKSTNLVILTSKETELENIIKVVKLYINLEYSIRKISPETEPIFKDYDGYGDMFKTWIPPVKVSVRLGAEAGE